jgi:glycosyltransferase involved in cell wall biosynthesis
MPKVLILCAHRPKRSPSQRYRFEQYLPFLESKGYQFIWSYLLNENDDRVFYSQGNPHKKFLILLKNYLQRKKDIRNFRNYDIILIQREAMFTGTSFVEKAAFKSNAKVIFDFDDSIWLEDTSPGNKKFAWIKKPAKFFENIQNAHLVTAGNTYLADKAKPYNKSVVIIPTTIDTDIHKPKRDIENKEFVTIGWSGSISTIKHFELLIPVLKKIKEKYGPKVGFKIMGDPDYVCQEINVKSVAWNEKSEVDELNSFDIGLMPLPNDEWSKGKCGLKGLSYMSCSVATVMSPVGINKEIIQHSINGMLAETDEEWFNILCYLIDNPDSRKEIGSKGRETVAEFYSVEANKNKYLNAFQNLLKK